jgi:hypothetical protein
MGLLGQFDRKNVMKVPKRFPRWLYYSMSREIAADALSTFWSVAWNTDDVVILKGSGNSFATKA